MFDLTLIFLIFHIRGNQFSIRCQFLEGRKRRRVSIHLLDFPSKEHGEFDPGSGRTLAACLTHASLTGKSPSGDDYSGGRVSNAWEPTR